MNELINILLFYFLSFLYNLEFVKSKARLNMNVTKIKDLFKSFTTLKIFLKSVEY